MNNKKLKLFSLLIIFFTGCAFARYQTPIHYQYIQKDMKNESLLDLSTKVGVFKDSRSINDPNMIINMKNGYGQTTSGGYMAERPVAKIIQNALMQGLKSKGVKLDKISSKIIEGELLDLEPEYIMGFWSGKFAIKFTIKILVKDSVTSKVLWRDTYIAKGKTKSTLGGIPVVRRAFSAALDDFVMEIISDELFLEQLR